MMLKVYPSQQAAWNDYNASYVGIDDSRPTELIGVGSDLIEIALAANKIRDEYYRPASRFEETVADKFDRLANQWKNETLHLSSIHQISMHPAYQEIIGMGDKAILLILREMEQSPDHWFWALRSITGVNPINDESRGNILKMTEEWLRWGRINEYLQS